MNKISKQGWYFLVTCAVAALVLITLGCTPNIRTTRIEFTQNVDGASTAWMKVDASGATNNTVTAQDARSKLAAALEGAQAALEGLKDAAASYAPDLSNKPVDNSQTNIPETPVVEKPATPAEAPAEDEIKVEEIE